METEAGRPAKPFQPHSQSIQPRHPMVCGGIPCTPQRKFARKGSVTDDRRDERPHIPDRFFLIGAANAWIESALANAAVGANGCNMSIIAIESRGLSASIHYDLLAVAAVSSPLGRMSNATMTDPRTKASW